MSFKPNLFAYAVPCDWSDRHTIKIYISGKMRDALAKTPRGEEHQFKGIIAFDRITKKWFAIRHHPCFSDCWDCCCATQAVQVEGPQVDYKWEPVVFPEHDED